MAEEAAVKRRKEAQVDFPRNSVQNGAGFRSEAQRNLSQQPQVTRGSPPASQASSRGKKSHSLGGGSVNDSSVSSSNIHPTPLFQRLVSEEVQELKAYARIIENQNRRLSELERVHGDLEVRLEGESSRRMELERTLEERERSWAEQIAELEKERDQWRDFVNVERSKNTRLMDQVVRKDQDIHRMLQRKYDQQKGDPGLTASIRNTAPRDHRKSPVLANGDSPKSTAANVSPGSHRSPHDILKANGSTEAIRERNVTEALNGFFGLG